MGARTGNNILLRFFLACWICLPFSNAGVAAEELSQGLSGDIGLGAYYARGIVAGAGDALSVLPYGDFEYGRVFARVDTLGIKTLTMGNGYLELAARFSQDGFNTDTSALRGLRARQTSIPLGVGTLQVTPIGAFLLNAFHDVRDSGGNWLEAIYAAEVDLPQVSFYPMLGADYQSGAYVRYYYGISTQEAAFSQYSTYDPGASLNPLIGLIVDIKLTDTYHLNCYVRRKWLGDAIRNSPVVNQRYLDTGYVALSYRYK